MYKATIKKNVTLFLSIMIFAICLGTRIPSMQVNASNGAAKIYLVNHGTVTSNGWTLGAANTASLRQERLSELRSMGYSASDFVNRAAGPRSNSATILHTLSTDRVFTLLSHGGPGVMYSVNSSNVMSRLSANASSEAWNYSLAANFNNPNLRFAHFGGCNTGRTHASLGNIATRAGGLGARVVLAHMNRAYTGPVSYLNYCVFFYGRTTTGFIHNNVTSARNQTLVAYNNSSESQSTAHILTVTAANIRFR